MSLTREQEFSMFDSAVKAITNANALMLSICFDDLLKLIVYNDSIRLCIADCYNSIDYERLLETSFSKNNGKFTVQLPKSKKGVVGFVTKLIYEFHLGTQSFDKLMISLYGESGDASLRRFADDVLNPYREAFRQVFLYEVTDAAVPKELSEAKDINPAVISETYVITAAMRSELDGNNKLSPEKRKDFMELVDGLCYTIERGDARAVRSAWLGLKLSLSFEKLCENPLSRLQTLLERYMLI